MTTIRSTSRVRGTIGGVLALLLLASGARADERALDARLVAEHLAGAIRFPTLSHQDPERSDPEPFDALAAYLRDTYPLTYQLAKVEHVNRHSLLIEIPGSDPAGSSALFMSHLDVVPVAKADLPRWTHPPFAGVIADGYVWGRGALDVKSGVIVWFEAAERLLREGYRPRRTLYLAFGHDEEIGGHRGAAAIAGLLGERGVQLEFVVDEGGSLSDDLGLVPGRLVAQVNTAEKTYFTLHLIAHGTGGHSSMPSRETAVGRLARAIQRLEDHPMPLHLSQPVRDLLQAMGRHQRGVNGFLLRHPSLSTPLIKRRMARDPLRGALLRTTTAVTMLHAGVKENIIPERARATVNFRILPDETPDDVIAHVRRTIDDPEIEIEEKRWPAAPPPARTDARGYRIIEGAVHEVYPEAVVLPGLLLGATDSRHYAPVAQDLYRFLGVRLTRELLHTIHGTDERIGVESLANAVRIAMEILRRAGE